MGLEDLQRLEVNRGHEPFSGWGDTPWSPDFSLDLGVARMGRWRLWDS